MKHKKPYIILPTLIIQLSNQDTSKDNRSFRRRSHESPYSSKSTQTAILFRPAPEAVEDLDKWRREISSRLTPHTPSPRIVELSGAEPHSAGMVSDFPDSPGKPPSMFLVNGEPNTALLSPSLRSKSSDLSSNLSEQKSSGSSNSDIHNSERKSRPDLQISTQAARKYDHGPSGRPQSLPASAKRPIKPTTHPEMPRETILDRFYSIAGVQPDPSSPSASNFAQLHQALLEQQAAKGLTKKEDDLTSKIPEQTQRALDFLSTGFIHPEDEPILSSKMKKTASSDGTMTLPGSTSGHSRLRNEFSAKQRTYSDDKIVSYRPGEKGESYNSNNLDPDIYSPRRASSTFSSRRNSLSSISGLSIETTSLSFTDSYHRQSHLSYQSPRLQSSSSGRDSVSTFTTVSRNQESRASVSSVLDQYYRADYDAAAAAAEGETVKEEDEDAVEDDDEVLLDDDELFLDEELDFRPRRRTSRSGSRTKLKSLLDL